MTLKEREEILSKDILSVKDVADLLGVSNKKASDIMCKIKHCIGSRVEMRGKLHTQDYLDYYKLRR